MGFITKHKRGVYYKYDLKNLRGYKRAYKSFMEGDAMAIVSYRVWENAYNIMKSRYYNTASQVKDRHNKVLKKSLEYRLFGSKPRFNDVVIKKGPGKYEVRIIKDIGALNRDIPHLKWQEEGIRPFIRTQMYHRVYSVEDNRWKFYPIKKWKARRLQLQDYKSIKNIVIKHPGLLPRHFILAAHEYFKSGQAITDFKFYVRQELKKRFKNA